MKSQIRRSTLILPVDIPRFVEKAYSRGADAIMMDLEDAVPLNNAQPEAPSGEEDVHPID